MVALRAGTADDLDWLMDAEAEAFANEFVGLDPRHAHEAMLLDGETRYYIAETGGDRAGYVIVRGVGSADGVVEIKRIVMTAPGKGHGSRVLEEIIRRAFEEWNAHRLWLDVYPENSRARHVYRALGFVEEGTLRDCVYLNGRHRSLIVMSILEHEYRGRGRY